MTRAGSLPFRGGRSGLVLVENPPYVSGVTLPVNASGTTADGGLPPQRGRGARGSAARDLPRGASRRAA